MEETGNSFCESHGDLQFMRKHLFYLIAVFVLFAPRAHPEDSLKGIYYGSHVFGSKPIIKATQELLQETEINTIIIDKKDDTGTEIMREHFKNLIRPFTAHHAHIVCRIVTLKDSVWAQGKGRAFAIKSKIHPENLWRDHKGNTYLDPLHEEVADYHVRVSLRAIEDGCEMLNYDYIRLPSARDGKTADMKYALSPKGSAREEVVRNMAEKRRAMQLFTDRLISGVRNVYPHIPLAVSIFGYACYGREPGIGQYLDDFARLGVTISCMAYPSHYSCNDGAQDPNTIPYEIYKKTHEKARAYLAGFGLHATFIPWVQGFDFRNINGCGGRRIAYASDPHHFRKQIKACNDLGIDSWFVWPSKLAFSRKDLYLPKAMLH